MNIYRIRATRVIEGVVEKTDFIELIAGLTPSNHIATGAWYGAVVYRAETHPFVLSSKDGVCQYAGGYADRRQMQIVEDPVEVDREFKMNWANSDDWCRYRFDEVRRLNTAPDE